MQRAVLLPPLVALCVTGCARVAPSPFSQPVDLPQRWSLPVDVKTVEPFTAVVLPMRGSYDQSRQARGRLLDYVGSLGVKPTGSPFGRFYTEIAAPDADRVWELGVPVPPGTHATPPFELRAYPRERVAFVILRSPPGEAVRQWPAFLKTAIARGLQPVGAGITIWHDDPYADVPGGPRRELAIPVWAVPIAERITIHVVCLWGAFLFLLFALLYLRQEHRRRLSHWGGYLWAGLAIACGLFYLRPVLVELPYLYGERWLGPVRDWADALSVAALPLFMHLWYHVQRERLRARWLFRSAIAAMYVLGAAFAACLAFDLFSPEWQRRLDPTVAALVAGIAVFGLAIEACARAAGPLRGLAAQRRVHGALLALTAVVALLAATLPHGLGRDIAFLLLRLVPIAFLFSAAYFNERVLFFDLFVKRGAFALALLGLLTAYFLLVPGWLWSERLGWLGFWVFPVSAAPLVAAAPWLYARLAAFIDRRWLGRRYSPGDAYREFAAALSGASTTAELGRIAEERLQSIFDARASVALGGKTSSPPAPDGAAHEAALVLDGEALGVVRIEAGAGRFLSEDQALLDSLAQALALTLENLRLREKKTEHEARERELQLNASRAELKALRAQINPHFLFNALNSIAALISREPERAEATVERLAEVFRYTLRRSLREWVRVEEELAFVRCYLDLEATRFGDRLETRLDVGETASEALVPAMSVQTLVENALKHGVAHVRGKGRVEVSVTHAEGRLRVEVRDNGPGFAADLDGNQAARGHGLRNVRERLHGHFGPEACLVCGRGPAGSMTLVTIEMPYLLAPPAEAPAS